MHLKKINESNIKNLKPSTPLKLVNGVNLAKYPIHRKKEVI